MELRRRHQVGAARLADRGRGSRFDPAPIWARHGVSRLSDLERRSGRVIRRIETTRPGELVHLDVKKQAKIPKGGGWRVHGRCRSTNGRAATAPRLCLHPLGHRRLQPPGVLRGPRRRAAVTTLGFWRRAKAFFATYGITIERVMTDNGGCYRARDFATELASECIAHTFTRPYRPQTNGKVERYNRTLLNEWAYARPYRSEAARTRALDKLAPHVQPSPAPHGHRGPTHHPRQQRGWAEQLDPYPATIRRVPIPTWSQLDQGGVTERRLCGMARPGC